MTNAILFKVPGRASKSPVKVLASLSLGQSLTYSRRFSWRKALAAAWRFTFSEKVSLAVAAVVIAAMYWHNITIADTLAAQHAVGMDCIFGMPWALVWCFRATRSASTNLKKQEGGEA